MKTFVTAEIRTFLRALDANLDRPFRMVVIGGAAAALAYKAVDYTRDIDTMNDLGSIEAAYRRAKTETGLDIPMAPAGVADAPYNYEERLRKAPLRGLKKLTLMVPEKHDLALMKIMRGYENDLATVAEIKKRVGLKLGTLVTRYRAEMDHVVGNKTRLRQNFLAAVERTFGVRAARKVEIDLGRAQ